MSNMHNVKMQITPYADYIPVMREIADHTATMATLMKSNLAGIASYILEHDATLTEIKEKDQKPVFELFVKNMSMGKFIEMGVLTSNKKPDHPFDKICIIERDGRPENDGYENGLGFGNFTGINPRHP